MVFTEEPTCKCGIYYKERITYRAIDDLPSCIIYPSRCTKCEGLITPDQREERAKHIDVMLKIL